PSMGPFPRGYAVGLLVGEGCFTQYRARDGREVPVCSVRLHARDPEPLLFLQRVLGGRVNGPYRDGKRLTLLWSLRGEALRRALPIFMIHLPDSHKREQLLAWLTRHEFYLLCPRRPNRRPVYQHHAE